MDSSAASTALYAFASDPGILVRSIDSGKTWSEADNGLPSFTESLPNAQQVVVDPSTKPATVYFSFLDSSNLGFFQSSTDMAASWTSPSPCPCSYPVAVGFGVVYAGPAVSKDPVRPQRPELAPDRSAIERPPESGHRSGDADDPLRGIRDRPGQEPR